VDASSILPRVAPQSLRGSYLFRGVHDSIVAELQESACCEHFREGEQVWTAGELARCFTVISRGLVLIQRDTPCGNSAVVGVFGPKESIGDVAALQCGSYPASACALTHVEVIRIPAAAVRSAMQRDTNLLDAIHLALIRHAGALQAKIDIVSAGSVPARLAMLLLHLAERFGDEDDANTTFVPVPLSRATLSRLVSARVETVIRVLRAWQRLNVLESTTNGFSIPKLEALRAIACEG
jgi:CRP-like cAMP-binding protein